ncbi:MAG: glycine betaine ABC transporter substrate-binding protein [Acidimicrobiales bacterium]
MNRSARARMCVGHVILVVLVSAACGGGAGQQAAQPSEPTSQMAERPEPDQLPGDGIEITMARANWSSEYIAAEIYRQILTELGYNVSNPADIEVGPGRAYEAMAQGTVDFWANGWIPAHLSWFQVELPDGSTVGDHLDYIGDGVRDAGVQGFLITKSWADRNGVRSIDQINADPALIAQLDENDANPGSGVWDLFGCEETWTCDDIIDSMIAYYGWTQVVQTRGAYDEMFAEFLRLVREEAPTVIYTWAPSDYLAQAVPGAEVLWLTMHPDRLLDDSNPLGVTGGEHFQQRSGFTGFGAATCTQPCQLGWDTSDLHVVANKAFLLANPVLVSLFERIRPDAIDLQALAVEQARGDGSQEHLAQLASRWRTDNEELIDGWIADALASSQGS